MRTVKWSCPFRTLSIDGKRYAHGRIAPSLIQANAIRGEYDVFQHCGERPGLKRPG